MASILCLAHYCDTHGPTPLMVTEESSVACETCLYDDQPQKSRTSLPDTPLPSAELSRNQSFEDSKEPAKPKLTIPPQTQLRSEPQLPFQTPPASPRIAALAPNKTQIPRSSRDKDSGFRRTYDESDKKRAIPCENCALTLPKQTSNPNSAASSPKTLDDGSPVLRTRQPCAVIRSSTSSTRTTSTPSDSDCDADPSSQQSGKSKSKSKSRNRSSSRSITSSTGSHAGSAPSYTSTSLSLGANAHAHYVDYTSAHDPLSATSFSLLRAACLRTLTMEALPPPRSSYSPSNSSAVSSPTSPLQSGSISKPTFPPSLSSSSTYSSSSSQFTASGGPIMFGDPRAGYTIAFIFRIPDPCARGRRRQYAFMCLCRGGERKAVRAFGMLTQVFREWAGWVTGLAEGEAVRVEGELASGGSGGAQGGQWAGGGSGYAAGLQNARANSVNEGRPGQGAFGGAGGFGGAPNTSNSSFLSGRMGAPGSQWEEARMGGLGVGRIRSRGLAELVGLPDFFLLLHVKFVELLARLRVLMEGG